MTCSSGQCMVRYIKKDNPPLDWGMGCTWGGISKCLCSEQFSISIKPGIYFYSDLFNLKRQIIMSSEITVIDININGELIVNVF